MLNIIHRVPSGLTRREIFPALTSDFCWSRTVSPPAPSVSTNFRGWDNVTIFHGIINIDYRWYLWSVHYTFFHRSPPAISLPLALVLLIRMGCWLSYFLPSCVTQLIGSGTDNFCSEEHLVKRSHSYAFSGPGNIWRLHLNKIQYRQ